MSRFFASILTLVAAFLPAAVPPAAAQEPGDAEAGHELASQLCTACHIVGRERVGSDLAPPFPVIARDPDTSLIELHSWVGPAHPMLPDLALTPQQVSDINAYLDSLRGERPREPTRRPPGRGLPDAPPERIGPPIGTQSE